MSQSAHLRAKAARKWGPSDLSAVAQATEDGLLFRQAIVWGNKVNGESGNGLAIFILFLVRLSKAFCTRP
jgi:hypothetical protein